MFASAKRSAGSRGAVGRVKGWTRERFRLARDETIWVAEIGCTLPGCPPLETVVAFWTADGTRHQFKVFKRVEEVVCDDLPYAWLKDALAVAEGSDFECC